MVGKEVTMLDMIQNERKLKAELHKATAELAEARREMDEQRDTIANQKAAMRVKDDALFIEKLKVNTLKRERDAARAAGFAEAKAGAEQIATSYRYTDKPELIVIPGVNTSAMNAQQLTACAIAARIAAMQPSEAAQ